MKRVIFVSGLLFLSACFRSKMAPPEVKLMEQAIAMKKEAPRAEFCAFVSSVVNHQRNTLGRRYVSSAPIVSFYAIDCLRNGMLDQKVFLFNLPATEKNLLYRAAICGEEQAVALIQAHFDPEFKPRFTPIRKDDGYYLEDTRPFSAPSDELFPYTSIDEETFCGYAETQFTLVGAVTSGFILLPTLVIGLPLVILGGVADVISPGASNS